MRSPNYLSDRSEEEPFPWAPKTPVGFALTLTMKYELSETDLRHIISEYFRTILHESVSKVEMKISSGSDDGRHGYSPPKLNKVVVTI